MRVHLRGRKAQRLISRFLTDTSGATAIEYALIASVVSLAILAGLVASSDSLLALYERIGSAVGSLGP